jgi:uncharacterized protein GlcG (DUF336 family)
MPRTSPTSSLPLRRESSTPKEAMNNKRPAAIAARNLALMRGSVLLIAGDSVVRIIGASADMADHDELIANTVAAVLA